MHILTYLYIQPTDLLPTCTHIYLHIFINTFAYIYIPFANTHTHTHKDKRVTVALRGSKDMSDLEIAITPRLFAAKSQHLAAPVCVSLCTLVLAKREIEYLRAS